MATRAPPGENITSSVRPRARTAAAVASSMVGVRAGACAAHTAEGSSRSDPMWLATISCPPEGQSMKLTHTHGSKIIYLARVRDDLQPPNSGGSHPRCHAAWVAMKPSTLHSGTSVASPAKAQEDNSDEFIRLHGD